MKSLYIFILLIFSSIAFSNTEIESLDERLTDLELSKTVNPVKVNLVLKNILSMFNIKDTTQTDPDVSAPVNVITFRLNMATTLANRVKLFAGIQAQSAYNNDLTAPLFMLDSRGATDKGILTYLYKAYADIKLADTNFILSIGRLPTTYGPPEHIKDGIPRQGTYPLTAYSLPIDGIALTYNFKKLMNTSFDFVTRSIYAPMGKASKTRSSPIDFATPNLSTEFADNGTLLSQMFEFRKGTTDYWKNLTFIFQLSYFKLAGSSEFSFPSYVKSVDSNAVTTIYSDNKSLMRGRMLSTHFETENLFGSKLSLYAAHSHGWTESLAKFYSKTNFFTPITSTTTTSMGGYIHDGKAQTGRTTLGLRYELGMKNFLGMEFTDSTRNAIPVLWSDEIYNMHSSTGTGYHLYFTKVLYNGNFITKVGYINFDEMQILENSSFVDKNRRIQNYFLNLTLRL